MALGRIAARQRDQIGFALVIQLTIPVGLGMVVQHAVQALVGVPPFGAEHRALRRVQRCYHLVRAPSFISPEQDARPSDYPCGMLAASDQLPEPFPLLRRQLYPVFLLNPNPPKGCVGAGYAREEKRG